MNDIVETIGGSLIQHGKENDRVYLMKLNPADLPGLVSDLDALATKHGYGKIFARVPSPFAEHFVNLDYVTEGMIPRFYHGTTDALFLGKFFFSARRHSSQREKIRHVIDLAHAKQTVPPRPLPTGFTVRAADESDVPAIAQIYRRVFDSYPFPIHDPAYLLETMRGNVRYFAVERARSIVAVASAEIDTAARNAEMTDFATLPGYLGNGLSLYLLRFMEAEMAEQGITMLYTIARSLSAPMNCTFARCGYVFAGTLINNTQISGGIESMNIWYREPR